MFFIVKATEKIVSLNLCTTPVSVNFRIIPNTSSYHSSNLLLLETWEIFASFLLSIRFFIGQFFHHFFYKLEYLLQFLQLQWMYPSRNNLFYCYWCDVTMYIVVKRTMSICSIFSSIPIFSTASEVFSPSPYKWKMTKIISKPSPQKKLHCKRPFSCFNVFPLKPPQKFKVQAKLLTIWPVFQNYISISYGYAISLCLLQFVITFSTNINILLTHSNIQ